MVVHNWSKDGMVALKSRIHETKRIWLSQCFAFFSFLDGVAHNCYFFSFGMRFYMPMIKATGMPMADDMGRPMTYVFLCPW